jgi:hypothetical protein
MEILIQAGIMGKNTLVPLMQEGNELIAILTASVKTARAAQKRRTS